MGSRRSPECAKLQVNVYYCQELAMTRTIASDSWENDKFSTGPKGEAQSNVTVFLWSVSGS